MGDRQGDGEVQQALGTQRPAMACQERLSGGQGACALSLEELAGISQSQEGMAAGSGQGAWAGDDTAQGRTVSCLAGRVTQR